MRAVNTMERFSPKILAGSLSIAVALYVGSYLCLCKPVATGILLPPQSTPSSGPGALATQLYVPTYRIGGSFSANLFRPLQTLDMKFFPGRWLVPDYNVQKITIQATPAP